MGNTCGKHDKAVQDVKNVSTKANDTVKQVDATKGNAVDTAKDSVNNATQEQKETLEQQTQSTDNPKKSIETTVDEVRQNAISNAEGKTENLQEELADLKGQYSKDSALDLRDVKTIRRPVGTRLEHSYMDSSELQAKWTMSPASFSEKLINHTGY